MSSRPFRFGVVASSARSVDEWSSKARRMESLGYATLVMPDTLKYTLSPWPALAVAAAATTSLRVGTYVLNNDYRHPALVAKDAASLDLLSGGRLELGIGAGRPAAAEDNRVLGRPFDAGSVRVARLAEAIPLLKSMLSGDNPAVSPAAVQQPHPPILLAGSGRQMLALAAREANIIALGLPPDATAAAVEQRIDWIREAAGARFDQIELNLNLMAVGEQVPRYVSAQLNLSAAKLAQLGAITAVVGTPDEMCATLIERRERLGISYLLVGDELAETFAPVVERLAGR